MVNDDSEITLKTVMEHISKMKYDLEKKIDGVASDLKEFRGEFRDFAKGVDDIDERVQEIEGEKLPKRIKRVELELGIAA